MPRTTKRKSIESILRRQAGCGTAPCPEHSCVCLAQAKALQANFLISQHKPRQTPVWSEDAEKELRELFDQGLTHNAIAAKMGKTRDAIISRCRLLGLKRRDSSTWVRGV